jgi:NAD(P)H-dependent flavin oxidoreductase YrpB (nitropropane dioxygenase family)
MTSRPFGINLNLIWPQEERLAIGIDEGVRIVHFFWGDPGHLVKRAHDSGLVVMQTVGTALEARKAVDAGVDIVVAQGVEAGGHVWGTVSTMARVPAVVDAVGSTPVFAAGGIADGRGPAAVLALGAAAGWIGTRFLGSSEANIHRVYRDRLLAADGSDTYLGTVFDIGWPPDAPGRTLRNKTIIGWEEAGCPAKGSRPGEGEIVAKSAVSGDIRRYQATLPAPNTSGDLDAMAMWAGQSVGLVRDVKPAAAIVKDIWAEAKATIAQLK